MNTDIRKLNPGDREMFEQLIRVFEDVFEMKDFVMPAAAHLEKLLTQEGFYVFVSLNEHMKVTGGLTAYTLTQYYSTRPLVYIYDLAVVRHLHRQGIGKKLIAAVTEHCKETGVEEVFVQADVADEEAVQFYHKTGATAEDVIHFYYPLNKP